MFTDFSNGVPKGDDCRTFLSRVTRIRGLHIPKERLGIFVASLNVSNFAAG